MKEFLQNGKISELKGSQNVSYILEEPTLFNITGYKVLTSQGKNGFVKCAKVLYNGKTKLLYFTSGQKNLKNMMALIDTDTFIKIILNLIKSVIDVKNNGFLSCQNIDISFDKIFVDTHTLAVNLIYLPIYNDNDDVLAFENDLRTELIKVITSTPSLANSKMSKVSSCLSNGSLSIEELYKAIKAESAGGGYYRDDKEWGGPPSGGGSTGGGGSFNQPTLTFTSVDPRNPVNFIIKSSEYIIGKNPQKVNGVISFNKAIGRVHCRFIFRNNAYYIIDGDGTKNSTNGTYINGSRLRDTQPHPVKSGDVIRLANSDFSIRF